MHISLSELETTLRKAVLGVGLPLGLSEEAGLAAKCLAINGIAPLAVFADALDAVENGRSGRFGPDLAAGGDFVAQEEGLALSALHAGPSACDLLEAGALSGNDSGSLAMTAVDVAAVVLGHALAASDRINRGISVAWQTPHHKAVEVVCRDGGLRFENGAPIDLEAPGPADLSITLTDRGQGVSGPRSTAAAVLADGITADDDGWSRVLAYAARCLVEASDASRLTGAGAGVVDTD